MSDTAAGAGPLPGTQSRSSWQIGYQRKPIRARDFGWPLRAVRRLDLRDVAAGAGDIRADLPPGAPVAEEASPFRRSGPGGDPLAGRNILADLAGGIGRQVATEAAGCADRQER